MIPSSHLREIESHSSRIGRSGFRRSTDRVQRKNFFQLTALSTTRNGRPMESESHSYRIEPITPLLACMRMIRHRFSGSLRQPRAMHHRGGLRTEHTSRSFDRQEVAALPIQFSCDSGESGLSGVLMRRQEKRSVYGPLLINRIRRHMAGRTFIGQTVASCFCRMQMVRRISIRFPNQEATRFS